MLPLTYQLFESVTSSTKPELDSIIALLSDDRATARGTMHKITLVNFGHVAFEIR